MGFFTKNKENYSPERSRPLGGNPYTLAREEWLERYGSYINRAAQWRTVAFICLLITMASITGNVIQASQYKVIPYLVEIDNLGNARAAIRADKAALTPERVVQAELASFIRNWRTVTADIDLQKKMIERLSFFAAGSSKGVIRQYYEQNNPYELAKKGLLIAIEIKGLPLSVSSNSYRVEWTEITRSHTGVELERHTYEATMSVQINPPTSDAVIIQNPGGVYVTSLATSKVLGINKQPRQVPNYNTTSLQE